jgi:hypothetical protein
MRTLEARLPSKPEPQVSVKLDFATGADGYVTIDQGTDHELSLIVYLEVIDGHWLVVSGAREIGR